MKTNLRYAAYESIKQEIIYFELKPGQKIVESEIAGNLNMSRTPVREALLMLESEKLVQCNGKAGYYVRKLSPQNTQHYYQLRVLLENFAAPIILENITSTELKALEVNMKEAQKALGQKDIKAFIRSETDFHQILYKASRSSVLIEILGPLSDKFHWLRSISLHAPGGAEQSLDEHMKIYDALKKKDIKKLKKHVQQHFENAEKKFNLMQGLFV